MKSIGSNLFRLSKGKSRPVPALQRVTAKELGLQERWFRDAIFAEPELVIGPCRTAGRVDSDEVWLPWRIEANFGAGPIDVLLVSSQGRIGIVETKLSYNPQKRREVVAQVLDYALALQDADPEDLPDLPESEQAPLEEDLAECLNSGRFLLIIAGDALDPRALRLSQSMLARHLTSEWDLVMVDLNVYGRSDNEDELLLVPELLGTVQSDIRQVVRVIVQGESPKARVVVDKIVHGNQPVPRGARLTSVEEFLLEVSKERPIQATVAQRLVAEMQRMAANSQGRITFGLALTSANLYYQTAGGPRRFVSLRTNGHFRVVLAYLRTAGQDDLIAKVVAAAQPTLTLDPSDHAGGLRYMPAKEAEILALLGRLERALKVDA